jgi:hypothetical protein
VYVSPGAVDPASAVAPKSDADQVDLIFFKFFFGINMLDGRTTL